MQSLLINASVEEYLGDLSGLMMSMVKASASVASTCQIQSLVLHKQKQNSIILNTAGQSDLTPRLMTLGIKQWISGPWRLANYQGKTKRFWTQKLGPASLIASENTGVMGCESSTNLWWMTRKFSLSLRSQVC